MYLCMFLGACICVSVSWGRCQLKCFEIVSRLPRPFSFFRSRYSKYLISVLTLRKMPKSLKRFVPNFRPQSEFSLLLWIFQCQCISILWRVAVVVTIERNRFMTAALHFIILKGNLSWNWHTAKGRKLKSFSWKRNAKWPWEWVVFIWGWGWCWSWGFSRGTWWPNGLVGESEEVGVSKAEPFISVTPCRVANLEYWEPRDPWYPTSQSWPPTILWCVWLPVCVG